MGWDKTLRSLWQRGEYTDICSKEELWAGVGEEEAKTALEEEVKGEEHKVMKAEERLRDKRPDGMVMGRDAKDC